MGKSKADGYTEIKVLGNIEAIQKRPQMYIGSTDDPTHLATEILDNAIDEAMTDNASTVNVYYEGGWFWVSDDGRGFPDKDNKGGDGVISACTNTHSGAKFDNKAYSASAGLHGVGLTAVNALSEEMIIETWRNRGKHRAYRFKGGKHVGEPEETNMVKGPGTLIGFKPSPKYFESVRIDIRSIKSRMSMITCLLPKIKLTFADEPLKPVTWEELLGVSAIKFHQVGGKTKENETVEVTFGYSESDEGCWLGSVNTLEVNSGRHIEETFAAMQEAWKPYLKDSIIEPQDIQCGLLFFVNCKIANPAYSSQTKERLAIKKDQYLPLADITRKGMEKWLKDNEKLRAKLLLKFTEYRKSMNERQGKKILESNIELGDVEGGQVERRGYGDTKLADCNSKDRKGTELFVVEGDSAAGSLKQARDRSRHAILPLRGKILNVLSGGGKSIEDIVKNAEIKALINAIGAGAFSHQDPGKTRYGKIILMTDADEDGKHILALLIGCLCYVCQKVVEAGYVYALRPPLYGKTDAKGKFIPIYSEKDLEGEGQHNRFKGLGEMNPDQISQVAFVDKLRMLVQVKIDKANMKEMFSIIGTREGKRRILEAAGLIVGKVETEEEEA